MKNSRSPLGLPIRKRVVITALVIFILFSFLIARFYSIQILEGKKWTALAERQHYVVIHEPFKRGAFFSTSAKENHPVAHRRLVYDIPKFHLYIDPFSIPPQLRSEISQKLLEFIPKQERNSEKVLEQFEKKSRCRKLANSLNKETQQAILTWWYPYAKSHKIARNALFFVKDYQRSYPFGKLMGQLLHTIQSQKNEKTMQGNPTGGLELYFNHYLKGKQGQRRLLRSPRNSLETGEVFSFPENGADIYLTIDPYLQAIAEEEVEKGVIRSNSKAGWAVMMNPQTGEILALAQYPFFYPADYQKYFNDPLLIENTKVKAVTDANEPGSVFKPFTVAMALKANEELLKRGEKPLFSPDEKISTTHGVFPGRSRPISDTSTHHYCDLEIGIQKSSNIYMARLAERMINRLGNQWFRDQLRLFGFGIKTGIELPAESPGVVPTPGKLHKNGAFEWSVPTPFSISFGHNIQMNTIQLARAFSVFANGGYLVEPTLVKKIVKRNEAGKEEVLLDHTSKERVETFPQILSSSIVDRVVRAMRYVTKPGGTAIKADVPGYTEYGKTSTPKKIVGGLYSEKLYCPLFAGATPANSAAFVLVVVMDEPEYKYVPGVGKNHHGGNCTAIVFKDISVSALKYLGIPPDDPYGYPLGDPRRNLDKTEWMTETRLLQEKYRSWNNSSTFKNTRI